MHLSDLYIATKLLSMSHVNGYSSYCTKKKQLYACYKFLTMKMGHTLVNRTKALTKPPEVTCKEFFLAARKFDEEPDLIFTKMQKNALMTTTTCSIDDNDEE